MGPQIHRQDVTQADDMLAYLAMAKLVAIEIDLSSNFGSGEAPVIEVIEDKPPKEAFRLKLE